MPDTEEPAAPRRPSVPGDNPDAEAGSDSPPSKATDKSVDDPEQTSAGERPTALSRASAPGPARNAVRAMSSEMPSAKTKRPLWIELPILVVVAVVVALVVRTFVLQTFYVPSGSMENTLLIGDRVLVNKMVYDFRDPHRGEVIVFKPPTTWEAGANKDDYIKRVIGISGDHVVCCNADGRITVNGKALHEEGYLYPGDRPSEVPFDITVPRGRMFVMGDHRSNSADSRAHLDFDRGTVKIAAAVGRAFAIYWPLSRWDALAVPGTFHAVPRHDSKQASHSSSPSDAPVEGPPTPAGVAGSAPTETSTQRSRPTG